jgi:hypothetical protein
MAWISTEMPAEDCPDQDGKKGGNHEAPARQHVNLLPGKHYPQIYHITFFASAAKFFIDTTPMEE